MFKNRDMSVTIRNEDGTLRGFTVYGFDGLFEDLLPALYGSDGDPVVASQILTQQGKKYTSITKYE